MAAVRHAFGDGITDRPEHGRPIHLLAAIDNGGYFEGDVSKGNLFRDSLVHPGRVSGSTSTRSS